MSKRERESETQRERESETQHEQASESKKDVEQTCEVQCDFPADYGLVTYKGKLENMVQNKHGTFKVTTGCGATGFSLVRIPIEADKEPQRVQCPSIDGLILASLTTVIISFKEGDQCQTYCHQGFLRNESNKIIQDDDSDDDSDLFLSPGKVNNFLKEQVIAYNNKLFQEMFPSSEEEGYNLKTYFSDIPLSLFNF